MLPTGLPTSPEPISTRDSAQLSPRGAYLMGALFVAAGVAVALVGLGVIPTDPASFKAPRWVIVLAGAVFTFGGASVINGYAFGGMANPDVNSAPGAPTWARTVQNVLGLGIVGAMLAIIGWVAFGPGERECTGSTSFTPSAPVSDWSCRTAFGVGFVILLAVAVAGAWSSFKRRGSEH